ncbi:MAG: ATP-grasp domain-containing protein [Proteobacteria bacterium]|nr:ATP-grasp domain-containing protein [Pseudomonadota bacterium]
MSEIVLFGNLRASLTLARSLARDGHIIHAGYDELDPYLIASRHVAGAFQHARPDLEPEAALAGLQAYLDRHRSVDVVIPVSDIAVRLISRNRSRFRGRARLILPAPEVVETCIDKAAMFDLCERLGVALAPRRIVTDHPGLLAAVEAIGRPCIVKPVDACHYLFDRKAIILRAGEPVSAAVPFWPAEHRSLCVQAFVAGPRHDISFAAHQGRLVGAVDCKVLRTDRADDTGYTTQLISTAPHPEVARGLEAMVRALGYTGVGDIEFMVDEENQQISFIELNPRLSASFKSAEVCGLPVSRLMLSLGLGEAPASAPDPWAYPVGRRTVWLKGELAGLKRQRRDGEIAGPELVCALRQLLKTALHHHHLTFEIGDPGPVVWSYLHPVLRRLGLSPPQPTRRRAAIAAPQVVVSAA